VSFERVWHQIAAIYSGFSGSASECSKESQSAVIGTKPELFSYQQKGPMGLSADFESAEMATGRPDERGDIKKAASCWLYLREVEWFCLVVCLVGAGRHRATPTVQAFCKS
jgi:hypothetical protein